MGITKLLPFSNATEFEVWKNNNCYKCDYYEDTSTKKSEAKCIHAFNLDLAQVSTEIPISTMNYFGYAKNYKLANCPKLHCGRLRDFTDYEKALSHAEKNKINELPFKK